MSKKDYERGYVAGLKAAVETLKESDPLEAVCEWEDADDIAHAVQRYLVQRLQDQFPPKKEKRP